MANPFQGDDEDPFEAARDSEGNIKQTGLAPSAKLSNFGAAFNMARKAGEKTFMFKGKKYTDREWRNLKPNPLFLRKNFPVNLLKVRWVTSWVPKKAA